MRHLWPIGLLSAAAAFPAMLFERLLPRMPAPERWWLGIEPDASYYHILKNVWTELIRADPQWWGKCLAFIIIWQAALIIYLLIRRRNV